jgi:hypothetical protein
MDFAPRLGGSMPKVRINFEEAFRNQRELAQKALQQVADLRETLTQLLPGDDPETGELRDDISEGIGHLAEIEALIRDQWFRNR